MDDREFACVNTLIEEFITHVNEEVKSDLQISLLSSLDMINVYINNIKECEGQAEEFKHCLKDEEKAKESIVKELASMSAREKERQRQ